jgi:hypothetical protein
MLRFVEIGEEAESQMKGLHPVALHGFVRGAEWADRTMLDRACEWLRYYGMKVETIDAFRRAMEE